MAKTQRVAIVGAGRMGRTRARSATLAGAEVRYVCDPALEVASELGSTLPNACVIETPQEIVWEDIDAVFVCTPPSARGDVELEAIRRGVPLFAEKPIGLYGDAVRDVLKYLKAAPQLTAVGYMNRCRHSVQQLQKLLRGQRILGISMDWLVGMYGVPWWAQKGGSGGPVNEQATHMIDLARVLVGEIDSVQALTQPNPQYPDLIGSASINLHFKQGEVGNLLYSCLAREKMIRLHVYTEATEHVLSGWDFRLAGDDSTAVSYADRDRIFDLETEVFLDAVAKGEKDSPLCTFADAWNTQLVVDTIHRSVKSGGLERVPFEAP